MVFLHYPTKEHNLAELFHFVIIHRGLVITGTHSLLLKQEAGLICCHNLVSFRFVYHI